ncbi:MAG: hypothetical protein ACRD50_03520 [Candidatus Acidiferrales bacterium]
MQTFWRGVMRVLFWSFERGSWPYDVMVLAILAFVLLTPRSWFHDQPQAGAPSSAQVQLLAEDETSKTYRLDANLLPPAKRHAKDSPELERDVHDLLGRSVEELKGHTFQIRHIQPVRGDDGIVRYYDVKLTSSSGGAP